MRVVLDSNSNQQVESPPTITCLMMKEIDFIMFNLCLKIQKNRKTAFHRKLYLVCQKKEEDSKQGRPRKKCA